MKKLLTLIACVLMAFTCQAQTYSYDVNHDGDITIQDIMAIVNNLLGVLNPGEGQLQSYLTCPDENHPHLIDLGLPSGTKWACCNVDTDHPEKQSPTNYGGYYSWGETETKSDYRESTYQYYKNVYQSIGSDIAGTDYDVAHVKWGGSWVMPTKEQQDELINNCTYEWATVNGVNGGRFTSKTNGGSIFLPAAGNRDRSYLYYAGSGGYYWSSTQDPSYASLAYSLLFNSGSARTDSYGRDRGRSVRPVVRN